MSALQNSKFKFPKCTTSTEFLSAFNLNNFNVSIGLIIDEFDNLMYHQEFVSVLRYMKHNPHLYCIKVLN